MSTRVATSTKTSQRSTPPVAAPGGPCTAGPTAVSSTVAIDSIARCIGNSKSVCSFGAQIATFSLVRGGTFWRARISRMEPTTPRNTPNLASVSLSIHSIGGVGHFATMMDRADWSSSSHGMRRFATTTDRCCQISSVTNGMMGCRRRRIVSSATSSIVRTRWHEAGSANRLLHSSR